jgi:hypothetical protein
VIGGLQAGPSGADALVERAIEAHEGMGGRVVEIDREIIARQILD